MSVLKFKNVPDNLEIVIDTREKLPYFQNGFEPTVDVTVQTLETGDYSVTGLLKEVVVERKSLADLYGSCGKGRKRFECEMKRLETFISPHIVVEADLFKILRCPPSRSKVNPRSVLASLIAWSSRYRISIWPCANRSMAEKITYRILERYWKDKQTGYHLKF